MGFFGKARGKVSSVIDYEVDPVLENVSKCCVSTCTSH